MSRAAPHLSTASQQRGGVMMVMLVILILGITTAFVTSLSGTALKNKRNQATADVLAQAKAALLSYAVSDPNRPGELPCPDTNNDGSAESNCSAAGNTLIGRLPWRTLDLPELRDGAAEDLWYVVSDNFHANGTSSINSDTPGTISINGVTGYSAIIFAPGAALPNQNRPASPTGLNSSAVYSQFLEAVINQASIQVQPPNDIAGGTYTYNDQLLSIRPDDFMPLIEKRLVREAKRCLDAYAADASNLYQKYPWAVPLSDSTNTPNRSGTQDVRFGRFPDAPNISTTGSGMSGFTPTQVDALRSKVQAVQDALNAYLAGTNSLSNLRNKGDNLKDFAAAAPYYQSTTDPARAAGIYADTCGGSSCTATLQSMLTAAFNSLNSGDSSMPGSWDTIPACQQLVNSTYWNAWRNFLFVQIADGYQPGGTGSCIPEPNPAATCLSITGSGNTSLGSGSYHAVVAIARGITSSNNSPRDPAAISDYLEGVNKQNKTGATPSVAFETYRSDDANYGTINDLVLCLDGYHPVNNPNANCK